MRDTRPCSNFGRPLGSTGGRRCVFTNRDGGVPGKLDRVTVVTLLVLGAAAPPRGFPAQAGSLSSQPATAPATREIRPFQPGVGIDWTARAVYVDGHVVLREGPIEFFACFAGKEHESIVRFDASATHIFMALGLIGLEPGHPPQWQEQRGCFGPPAGDLVDVTVEWNTPAGGHSAAAFDWLREFEFGQPPIDRPWVFGGSRRLGDGTVSSERSGEGLAVVDKPDSLLALSRSHVSRDADLWTEANTGAIAPLETRVRVVFRPARPRAHDIRVDFRGAALVDGRFAHFEDVADLIALARRLSPNDVQRIKLTGTLRADVARLRSQLEAANVPADAVRFERDEPLAPGTTPDRQSSSDTAPSP